MAMALCLGAGAALADPGYYVVTPYANDGVRTVDIRYWTVKPNDKTEVLWPEIGFAWGVNSRWTTELFLSFIGSAQDAMVQSTLNWQNNVMLTQGNWPVDVALHLQWIRDRTEARQNAVEYGLLLQTDWGRTQFNTNFIFARDVGGASTRPTQFRYQWQVRHRWVPGLHLGFQGFGETGEWGNFAPHAMQSHRAGPAVFTTWRLGPREAVHVQAAWLEGRTYRKSGHMFTMRAHSDF